MFLFQIECLSQVESAINYSGRARIFAFIFVKLKKALLDLVLYSWKIKNCVTCVDST